MYLAVAADNVPPRMHITWRLKLPRQIKILESNGWYFSNRLTNVQVFFVLDVNSCLLGGTVTFVTCTV
jgi:hypothetical protein